MLNPQLFIQNCREVYTVFNANPSQVTKRNSLLLNTQRKKERN